MDYLDTDQLAREYRDAYDEQLRSRLIVNPPDTAIVDTVGPVRRKSAGDGSGLITYTDLAGMDGSELDEFIVEQREHFAKLNQSVEWKYHGYDQPADLPDRLRAAGFIPEEQETIVIGEAADHLVTDRLADVVRLRELTSRSDMERVRGLQEIVWGDDLGGLPEKLTSGMTDPSDPVVVIGAEADGELVCAAWIRFHKGTEFTSLWGGSTLPDWRGKGIYRAMVVRRCQLAVARGFKYVQFDCTDESRIILRRLGMLGVATTVPYVWQAEKPVD